MEHAVDPGVSARWRVTPGPVLGDRPAGTWAARRDGVPLVVKFFDDATYPDWRYPVRVADALHALGWPTPRLADEPIPAATGTWALFHHLPGRPRPRQQPGERRHRGRLLAELHASAAATGITVQRNGFADPASVVSDPALDRWLRAYERIDPSSAVPLRRCREAAVAWFAAHPHPDAPRSVIHSDFTPWNLLFDGDRLTGLLDFEGTHLTFQVADFALSWRGYQDDVLLGYDEVRPLSDLEWHLIRPCYWAWMFIDLTSTPPGHSSVSWQLAHLHKHSPLLDRKAGPAPRFA
ncbi:phosphotransferase [Catenuloplanes atrovinosus]|uniref:Ser/Thr protein kinase RdoA (MazF antagonist) n=1 Tax=Catenuloplanes atrovinosus TaxID=137266 RepID=A0AAE3YLP0_9ACTN|nr:phosphotransferase [Catenuloplanes atrovinosus]MDR7276124.1 Ser/Thr protein kinase RdoA (MazF antagonist) [Catenuloplanes atrovinosus]